jgi:hypothetical protein
MDALRKNFKQVATDYFSQELFYKTTDSAVRKRVLNDVYGSDSTIAVDVLASNDYDEVGKAKAWKKTIHLINSDVSPTDSMGFKKAGIPFEISLIHATGHYPMIEKPREFNAILEATINKILEENKHRN